jgi:hypothetical protein
MSSDLKRLREIKISCDSHRKKIRREALLYLDPEDTTTISTKLISDNLWEVIKIQNKYLKGCTYSECSQGYYLYGKRKQLMKKKGKNKGKGSMARVPYNKSNMNNWIARQDMVKS